LTAEVKVSKEEPKNQSEKESKWTKRATVAGAIFGLIGALAAALVFVLPTKDGRNEAARAQATRSPDTPQNPNTVPRTSSTTMAPNERHLADLPLAKGGGVVKIIDRRDLSMPCGSGQSDDRYREIEYELPGPYTSFITQAGAVGRADAEASVGVQIFIRARQDRSDRTLEVGSIRVQANGSETLAADITNARAILLRITCSTSTLTATFTDPRIGR
jgi:hypothetical protein